MSNAAASAASADRGVLQYSTLRPSLQSAHAPSRLPHPQGNPSPTHGLALRTDGPGQMLNDPTDAETKLSGHHAPSKPAVGCSDSGDQNISRDVIGPYAHLQRLSSSHVPDGAEPSKVKSPEAFLIHPQQEYDYHVMQTKLPFRSQPSPVRDEDNSPWRTLAKNTGNDDDQNLSIASDNVSDGLTEEEFLVCARLHDYQRANSTPQVDSGIPAQLNAFRNAHPGISRPGIPSIISTTTVSDTTCRIDSKTDASAAWSEDSISNHNAAGQVVISAPPRSVSTTKAVSASYWTKIGSILAEPNCASAYLQSTSKHLPPLVPVKNGDPPLIDPLRRILLSSGTADDHAHILELDTKLRNDPSGDAAVSFGAGPCNSKSLNLAEKPSKHDSRYDLDEMTIEEFTKSDEVGSPSGDVPPATLYRLLYDHRVRFEELRLNPKHAHIMELVKHLISVASNCGPIMEVWPTAYKTYNCLVPNFLNLPFLLWGVAAPRSLVSLALYYSSRAAGCSYCILHTCVFAIRRGTPKEAVMGVHLTPKESAVARFAFAMGTQPCRVTAADRSLLRDHFSDSVVEWIVLACCMMGFLNRWMFATCVDLESTAVEEVEDILTSKHTGWTPGSHLTAKPEDPTQMPSKRGIKRDNLISNLALMRHFPAAIRYDMEITKDVPKSWPEVGQYMAEHTGHTFPILAKLKHSRAIVALATMIKINVNAIECSLDLELKYLIAMVYAGVARNSLLYEEFKMICTDLCPEISEDTIRAVSDYAWDQTANTCNFDNVKPESTPLELAVDLPFASRMVLIFAKAASWSPPQITPHMVEIADLYMTPEQVVELVTWVSVMNMLHRFYCFYFPGSFEGPRLPFEPIDPELEGL